MNLFIVLTLTLASASLAAAEEKKDSQKDTKNYQTLDLKQFDSLKDQSNAKVKIALNCKTDSGMEYKAGEMGYDQCVKSSKKNQNDSKSGAMNKGTNNGAVEIKFGE